MRQLCLILLLLFLSTAHAAELQGVVTGIADGDTLYVTDDRHRTFKIRLLGIDAPEHGQAFGEASKRSLKQLAHRQVVRVVWQKHDRYGRLLGRVYVSGKDAGLHQLQGGLAWWNRKYAHEQDGNDAILYREAEYMARKKRLGLWSQAGPVPPWRWRYAKPSEGDRVKQ